MLGRQKAAALLRRAWLAHAQGSWQQGQTLSTGICADAATSAQRSAAASDLLGRHHHAWRQLRCFSKDSKAALQRRIAAARAAEKTTGQRRRQAALRHRSSSSGSGSGGGGWQQQSGTAGGGWGGFQQHMQQPAGRERRGFWAEFRHRNQTVLLGGGAVVVVVWWRSREEIPYTHRKHAILLPVNLERAIGEMSFEQVLEEAKQKGQLLPAGHPAQVRVETIGQRIAEVAGDGTGGGFQDHMKVVVFSKMLELRRSDDELASVLAHETSHVLARHAAERITEQGWITVFQALLYLSLGFHIPSDLFGLAFSLPHSRKQETEADIIGMDLAARACFDPAAGKEVFARLGEIEKGMPGSSMPTMLRTHPLSEARVLAIEAHLPKAKEWQERAGCNSQLEHFYEFFR